MSSEISAKTPYLEAAEGDGNGVGFLGVQDTLQLLSHLDLLRVFWAVS